MKKIVTIVAAIGISIAQMRSQEEKMSLQYENFTDINFPSRELKKYYGEKIVFFDNDTIGRYNLYPGDCINSSSKLYNYLINKNIVSGYVDLYKETRDPQDKYHLIDQKEYLKVLKKSLKLYYNGRVAQQSLYESHLFTIYQSFYNFNIKKQTFLLNINKNKLLSIVFLSNYSISDGFGYMKYTISKGKNCYLQGIKIIASDVIDTYEGLKGEPDIINFNIDSNGFIIIKR